MILLSLAAALVLGGAAYARSPDATRTPTATATATSTPTPAPSPTPTPTLPPEQVARFSGEAWLDAFGGYDRFRGVAAKIGDTVCGHDDVFLCDYPGPCLHPAIDPEPLTLRYHLDVGPAAVKPGCGYEGAPVTFFVGDRPAEQTAVWHGGTSQEVNLTAGPPFALFKGSVAFPAGLDPSLGHDVPIGMNAYIGDNLCGQETRGGVWRGLPYGVVVNSAEQQAGCGTEGAQVSFKLRDRQGNIIGVAREKGVWHAWGQGNVGQELDLTMAPVGSGITLGNMGDGSSQRSDAAFWAELSLGLSVVGVLGIAIAVALRRRAAAR